MSLSPFQLPSLLPRFDETYARSYCFSAHYIYHLLVNGYKFTEETWPQIRFEKEVSPNMERLLFLSIERFVEERSKVKGYSNPGGHLLVPQEKGRQNLKLVLPRVLQTRRRLEWSGQVVRLLRVGLSGHARCQPSAQGWRPVSAKELFGKSMKYKK